MKNQRTDWPTWSQILRWILITDGIVITVLYIAYQCYRARWPY